MKLSREFALIDWIRQHAPLGDDCLVGPGDDCAVLRPSPTNQLLTTDMLMEGSCFLLAEAGAYRVGRKAMNVNLSDIAAMAGLPRHALVSLGIPRDQPPEMVHELYRGLLEAANRWGVSIIGGDTNSWDGPLTLSVTLLGEAVAPGPVRRNGAKRGDAILVTGSLGGSIHGHHLDFVPRVREAQILLQQASIHAMIDISDGLAKDLHHICVESGCGALLEADAIPCSPTARTEEARTGRPALDAALHDGEDFELIFCVCPADAERLLAGQPLGGVSISRIGTITESGYLLRTGGATRPLAPRGYEHQW